MRGRLRLGIIVAVSVVLVSLVVVLLFAGSSPVSTEPQPLAGSSFGSNESQPGVIPFIADLRSLDPSTALKYGITGYVEITYPSDSPGCLSVDRGQEIDIQILLRFVSYAPEKVTQAEVNMNPFCGAEAGIMLGDVSLSQLLVSYSPGGNITIEAGQTRSVTMHISIPHDLDEKTTLVPLGAMGMGITSDFPMVNELGLKDLTIDG